MIQMEVISVEDGVADLQVTYITPGDFFVGGAARDVSVTLIEVQLLGIDAMMQDYATFTSSSMSGVDTEGYDRAHETVSGAGWDATYYNDVDGQPGSGDGVRVSPEGEETYFDNDVDNDGISNSDDDDIDGDGIPNSEDDDDDGDGVNDDDDAFPEDDENSIWGTSDGGLMIFSAIFDQMMNQVGDQTNTESMLQGVESSRLMNQYMNTLTVNINENLAGVTEYSSFITDSYGGVGTGTLGGTGTTGGTLGGTTTTSDSDDGPVDSESLSVSVEIVSVRMI